jgi:hypothetical protein
MSAAAQVSWLPIFLLPRLPETRKNFSGVMRFCPGYSGGAAPIILGFPVRRGGTNLTLKIITQIFDFTKVWRNFLTNEKLSEKFRLWCFKHLRSTPQVLWQNTKANRD